MIIKANKTSLCILSMNDMNLTNVINSSKQKKRSIMSKIIQGNKMKLAFTLLIIYGFFELIFFSSSMKTKIYTFEMKNKLFMYFNEKKTKTKKSIHLYF